MPWGVPTVVFNERCQGRGQAGGGLSSCPRAEVGLESEVNSVGRKPLGRSVRDGEPSGGSRGLGAHMPQAPCSASGPGAVGRRGLCPCAGPRCGSAVAGECQVSGRTGTGWAALVETSPRGGTAGTARATCLRPGRSCGSSVLPAVACRRVAGLWPGSAAPRAAALPLALAPAAPRLQPKWRLPWHGGQGRSPLALLINTRERRVRRVPPRRSLWLQRLPSLRAQLPGRVLGFTEGEGGGAACPPRPLRTGLSPPGTGSGGRTPGLRQPRGLPGPGTERGRELGCLLLRMRRSPA